MGRRKRNSIDRISQLPQSIQHHILSFLKKNKEIARITVLSKAWRGIVESRPVLEFNQREFKYWRRSFVKLVHRSIQKVVKQNLYIQEFNLEVESYGTRFDVRLDHWMQKLVNVAKVKVLSLKVRDYRYVLPQLVLLSETITDLRLRKCKLEKCSSMSMPNLLHLSLDEVTLRQDMIGIISSGCPNLEVLNLFKVRLGQCSSVRMPKLLHLTLDGVTLTEDMIEKISSGCPNLEILKLLELSFRRNVSSGVKIIAPRLRVFKVSMHRWDKSDTEIDLLACESTLRKLKLCRVNVTEGLQNLVSKFHGLEGLALVGLCGEGSLVITNQKLRKLKVTSCLVLERLEIDSHNLRVFKYDMNKLPFYSINSSFPPNDTIDFCVSFPIGAWYDNESPRWSDRLKDLFNTFSRFTDMKLIVSLKQHVIVYEELDKKFINILSHMKDNKAICVKIMRIPSYENLADHLFGCNNKSETVSIVSRYGRNNEQFVKILNKKSPKENEEPSCCKFKPKSLKPKKCWKHRLHDAEMIYGEIERFPNLFRSLSIMEYEITRIKLRWS